MRRVWTIRTMTIPTMATGRHPGGAAPEYTLREALRARDFWLLLVGWECVNIAAVSTVFGAVHTPAEYARPLDPSYFYTGYAVMSAIALPGGGLLGDRLGLRRTLRLLSLLPFAGTALLLMPGSGSPAFSALAGILLAAGNSGFGGPSVAAVGAYFGRRNFALLTGIGALPAIATQFILNDFIGLTATLLPGVGTTLAMDSGAGGGAGISGGGASAAGAIAGGRRVLKMPAPPGSCIPTFGGWPAKPSGRWRRRGQAVFHPQPPQPQLPPRAHLPPKPPQRTQPRQQQHTARQQQAHQQMLQPLRRRYSGTIHRKILPPIAEILLRLHPQPRSASSKGQTLSGRCSGNRRINISSSKFCDEFSSSGVMAQPSKGTASQS